MKKGFDKKMLFVKKRDGSIVSFNSKKIETAILRAMSTINFKEENLAKELTGKIILDLNKNLNKFEKEIPTIEQIQNCVEKILEENNEKLFKVYSLYRRSRHHAREIRCFFKIKDDLKFSANALKVLEERYLLKDNSGKIIETPTEMFRRVARAIAEGDSSYNKKRDEIKKTEEEFFELMKNLEFLPNSPTLMNAGLEKGQLAACFVLPIGDNLISIFNTLKNMAIIQQTGGGTGFSFSNIRPRGDIINTTKGVASGPVSFIKIYDSTTNVIKQGGKRRGANMAVLNIEHPDIEEFISSKKNLRELSNFNISIGISDNFMNCVLKNQEFSLINPKNKKIVKKINAKKLFEDVCKYAWFSGDPGLVFLDEINRKNPTPKIGRMDATNPCGEVPLLNYESCNLGSINLSKIVENGKINYEKLKKIVHSAVHFLDNVIDCNKYPLPEIEKITKDNRKIGLGIMGFADILIKLRISYNSQEALEVAEKIISFISKEAKTASVFLGKERGNFPNFGKSTLKIKFPYMRNATVTTIAPTGSISIIAGCSSGIEPLFAITYIRDVMEGKQLLEINNDFKLEAIQQGIYRDSLIKKIALTGTLEKTNLPGEFKKIYITSLEIPIEQQIKIQSIFQKHVDNAVSKTINLKKSSGVEEIKKAYLLAWKLKCKGITVYRYGSKPSQVLYVGKKKALIAKTHYSGGKICGECST